MTKYQVIYIDSAGDEISREENLCLTREEAESVGCVGLSDYTTGCEVLYMSNPGDYPLEDNEEIDFDILEIDEE